MRKLIWALFLALCLISTAVADTTKSIDPSRLLGTPSNGQEIEEVPVTDTGYSDQVSADSSDYNQSNFTPDSGSGNPWQVDFEEENDNPSNPNRGSSLNEGESDVYDPTRGTSLEEDNPNVYDPSRGTSLNEGESDVYDPSRGTSPEEGNPNVYDPSRGTSLEEGNSNVYDPSRGTSMDEGEPDVYDPTRGMSQEDFVDPRPSYEPYVIPEPEVILYEFVEDPIYIISEYYEYIDYPRDLSIYFDYTDTSRSYPYRARVSTPNGGALNVRATTATSAQVVGKLADGTIVTVWARSSDLSWSYIVSSNGIKGYVLSRYLTTRNLPMPSSTRKDTATGITIPVFSTVGEELEYNFSIMQQTLATKSTVVAPNGVQTVPVFYGPSTGTPSSGTVDAGSKVTLQAVTLDDQWAFVQLSNGQFGYIPKIYLQIGR